MPTLPSTRIWLGLLLAAAACSDQDRNATATSAPDEIADRIAATAGTERRLQAAGMPAAIWPSPRATASPVPEPTTIFLFGSGLIVVARLRRRQPQVI